MAWCCWSLSACFAASRCCVAASSSSGLSSGLSSAPEPAVSADSLRRACTTWSLGSGSTELRAERRSRSSASETSEKLDTRSGGGPSSARCCVGERAGAGDAVGDWGTVVAALDARSRSPSQVWQRVPVWVLILAQLVHCHEDVVAGVSIVRAPVLLWFCVVYWRRLFFAADVARMRMSPLSDSALFELLELLKSSKFR